MSARTISLPEGYWDEIRESRQRAEHFWAGTLAPTPSEVEKALTKLHPSTNWWEREEAIAIRDAARIRGLLPNS